MPFNHSAFWTAFSRAGMLTAATYQPASGPAVDLEVKFEQPDATILGDMVQSTEYSIEYPTELMPAAAMGESLVIDAGADSGTYTFRGPPEKVGDGYFSRAKLSKQS
jgi:hypothetical protein